MVKYVKVQFMSTISNKTFAHSKQKILNFDRRLYIAVKR
jgi:hypothetical protein